MKTHLFRKKGAHFINLSLKGKTITDLSIRAESALSAAERDEIKDAFGEEE